MSIIKRLRTRFDRCATGWKVNPEDNRDHRYITPTKYIAKKKNLIHLLPSSEDWLYQGNLGSCVAHGIANQIYGAETLEYGAKPEQNISRRYLYYYARYLENLKRPTGDNGCYPRLAYKSLTKLGVPLEEYWKYRTSRANRTPKYKARKAAFKRHTLEYVWLNKNPDTIRAALNQNKLIAFGTQVTPKMRDYRTGSGEILGDPRGNKLLGGHYMCIFGYEKNHFLVANSWHGREIFLLDESWMTWVRTNNFCIVNI